MVNDPEMVRGNLARACEHGSNLTARRCELEHGETFVWSIIQSRDIAQAHLEGQKGLPVTALVASSVTRLLQLTLLT